MGNEDTEPFDKLVKRLLDKELEGRKFTTIYVMDGQAYKVENGPRGFLVYHTQISFGPDNGATTLVTDERIIAEVRRQYYSPTGLDFNRGDGHLS